MITTANRLVKHQADICPPFLKRLDAAGHPPRSSHEPRAYPPLKASTPELQVNAELIRALLPSLIATAEAEGDSPISQAALLLALKAKRFEQAAIGAMGFEPQV